MHQRQRAGVQARQPANGPAHAGVQTGIVEHVFGHDGRAHDIGMGQGAIVAKLGEQIAAQQRTRSFLVEKASFPAMRNMGRIEIADAPALAQVDRLPIFQNAGRAIGHVVQRHVAGRLTVGNLGLGGDGQPVIHRTAFVRLVVTEGDPTQLLRRDQPADGFAHQRKHPPGAGVKQQGLVSQDEKLVEGEPGRGRDFRNVSGEAKDTLGDFVDLGLHDITLSTERPVSNVQSLTGCG